MAPDGYLRGLLADGVRRFRHRTGVRELLGQPSDTGVPVRFTSSVPRPDFSYLRPYGDGLSYRPGPGGVPVGVPRWLELAADVPADVDAADGLHVPDRAVGSARPVQPADVAGQPGPVPAGYRQPTRTAGPPRDAAPSGSARPGDAPPSGSALPLPDITLVIPGVTARLGPVRPGRSFDEPADRQPASRPGPSAGGAAPPPSEPDGDRVTDGRPASVEAVHPRPSGMRSVWTDAPGLLPAEPPPSHVPSPDPMPPATAAGSHVASARPPFQPVERPSAQPVKGAPVQSVERPSVLPVKGLPVQSFERSPRRPRAPWRPSRPPVGSAPSPPSDVSLPVRPWRRAEVPPPVATPADHHSPAELAAPAATPPLVVVQQPEPPPVPAGTPLFWERRHLSRLRARILR